MEPKFVCTYTPTVKKAAELTRKLHPIKAIVVLLFGIAIFCYITVNAIRFDFDGVFLFCFLFAVLYLGWAVAMPEINAFLAIRRAKKDQGAYPLVEIAFGDSIEITEGSMKVIWKYEEIHDIRRFKHTYALLKNNRTGFVLDPDSFKVGTFDQFQEFLQEKCPNVYVPK